MSRAPRAYDQRCHVCGTTYRREPIQRPGYRSGHTYDPATCPACGAPARQWVPPSVNLAMDAVLVALDEPQATRLHGGREGIVHAVGEPPAVDRLIALTGDIDWGAWLAWGRSQPAFEGQDVVLAAIERGQTLHRQGELAAVLATAFAPARAALEAEHTNHRAIFEARKK